MFRNLLIIFALTTLLAAMPAYSQESPQEPPADQKSTGSKTDKELTLDEVLENYYEAVGGIENWRDINTMRMGGVMVSMGQPVPVRSTLMRPNKCRVEFKVKNAVIVQAYDGERGWQHNPNGQIIVPTPMSEGRSNYLHDTCDLDGPLNDYEKKGNRLELLGIEELYGQDTYKIKITHQTGNVQTYYLDAQTFLPVRLDGVYQMDGKEHKVTTSFFDYRKKGKIIMPHKIDFDITGSPGTEEMSFKTVEINPRVNPSYFKKPD